MEQTAFSLAHAEVESGWLYQTSSEFFEGVLTCLKLAGILKKFLASNILFCEAPIKPTAYACMQL